MRQRGVGVGMVVLSIILVAPALFGETEQSRIASLTRATVMVVHDGDTFKVRFFDTTSQQFFEEWVRIIGIDTPEMRGPKARRTQPYARQAHRFLANLISGREVYLEREVSERDRYHRLLFHVYLVGDNGERGQSVGEALLLAGYAIADPWLPDIRNADRYADIERQARAAHVGRWHQRTKKKVSIQQGERASFAFLMHQLRYSGLTTI